MKKLLILMILFPLVAFGQTVPHWTQIQSDPFAIATDVKIEGDLTGVNASFSGDVLSGGVELMKNDGSNAVDTYSPFSYPVGAVAQWTARGSNSTSILSTGGVIDTSGNGYHATAGAGTTIEVDPIKGQVFNLNTSAITINNAALQSSTAISYSVWYKHTEANSTGTGYIMSSGRDSPRDGFNVAIVNGTIRLHYGNDGVGGANYLDTGFTPTEGVWCHIVATFDNVSGAKVYINRELKAQSTNTSLGFNQTTNTAVGRMAFTSLLHTQGPVAIPKIFHRVLNQKEINALFSFPVQDFVKVDE